ncbi:partner of Y14 and mago isoform X2 [Achroia grisella]|uniref:partner of Y14 and mago isoform X2 n=1 Tax=Achroia grisella TaxID=688607 RepID=UPI0027D24FE0|nr:partner of Y14 and mago isoform X2 [Achroia grisella]
MSTTAYEHDADGCKFIPATQRPDGTWRKPRRIKDGYVPQEEVPLYESKGKQFKARQNTGLPVGLTPEIVAEAQRSRKNQSGVLQPIPGMVINVEKKKKKKKTGIDDAADKLAKCEITEPVFTSASSSPANTQAPADPAKKLKNLRKKLRDIECLEEKIKSGNLKNPDKDQREKMSKKNDIIKEIELLEKQNSV